MLTIVTPKINAPTEAAEQIKCVQYLDILKLRGNKILYSATAQNTYTKSWNQKAKNKAGGVRKGLPDLIILVNNTLIFIELKRTVKSVTSVEQKQWLKMLNEAKQNAFVCKGFLAAKAVIDSFLLTEKPRE